MVIMDTENGDQVTKRGYLCPQDSMGGGGCNYPQDSRGVGNPNNPPYLRHCNNFSSSENKYFL